MTVPEISVQLYAIHHELDADLDGSLGRLAEIGFRNVEAFDFVRRVDALKTSFERHGLSAPTAHALILTDAVDTPDHLLKVATAAETFEAAAALGIKLVIDPFVAADQWTSRTDVERTAGTLNARAEEAAAYGLKVGYHNHDHELTSVIDGRPALEVFADLLDPSVLLEVDLYWAARAGSIRSRWCSGWATGCTRCTSKTARCARASRPANCRRTSARPARVTFR